MNDLPRQFANFEAFQAELCRLNREAHDAGAVRNGSIIGALMPPGWAHRYDRFVSAGRKAGYVLAAAAVGARITVEEA
ncbi:hypothetical protein [Mycolicibacterium fortuitum]|uniref:Uncharacterized protein n=1 Tax=Mycolicibacterium fortuitum TaxID=1766 RepID=A0AAE5AAQ6_MYCFO|nr:hypothetical protein [Mycolicibacterium fortuitum]MDV7194633.1 hypothetical protein [Mycolicibacterium fortuitum]MDV7208633.1 hypothetical protein [Mycolicibacterium fortuitum]MDV7230530.1 hypothetical protein [Mycolicibacterium fortuitum]MDV7261863.1 hypothetical protein [Mycolicibacterium fortuitum]MDV7287027.1 hypothetical protein [Mycolicibacterium fortuitum]